MVDDISNLNEKDYDECSKIVFSSGTTSNPKAVMLSLKNIFAGWEPLQRRTKFDDTDVIYLFLPLHHTYGNIYNFLYSFLSGLSIYLSSGVNNISSELLEINPTIFCAVPLIYRKFYEVAKDKLIYAFGNRIKYLYCGGSYLDTEIRKYYKQVGLPLHEAYALTETASSFSIEYTNNDDFESVGTIFENIDVKIIDSDESGIGEIIVKGDNVCLGYANNEQMNKQNFVDGYFKTGDLGYIKDNKLYLTGRKKKVLVGENGENVYIEEIINKLKELNQNINHAKIYFEDNQLCATVYVKEEIDVDSLFIEYNNNSLKKDKIHKYKMIIDNINSRLKG